MFFEKRIMSSQEQEVILDWMLEVQHKFVSNPMGNHRNYYIFSDDPSAPKVLFDIKKRIYKKEKLGEVYIEPMYKDYIGCILEGGHIHKHKDANVGNLKHVRYNVFLTVPKKGGVPFYMNDDQYEKWKHTDLTIDAVNGIGGMFSLDNGTGRRFLTKSEICLVVDNDKKN
jgi:uncharacterized protein (DUF779 family)